MRRSVHSTLRILMEVSRSADDAGMSKARKKSSAYAKTVPIIETDVRPAEEQRMPILTCVAAIDLLDSVMSHWSAGKNDQAARS